MRGPSGPFVFLCATMPQGSRPGQPHTVLLNHRVPDQALRCYFCERDCGRAEGFKVIIAYGVALWLRKNEFGPACRCLCYGCCQRLRKWDAHRSKVYVFHSQLL